MFELETARTIIREFRETDLPEIHEVLSDHDVMEFSSAGSYSEKRTKDFIAWCLDSYEKNELSIYAIVLKDKSIVVGYCGFYIQNIENEKYTELSYRLNKKLWGKGLVPEACKKLIEYTFINNGFDKLISLIDDENENSIRVSEKIGMTLDKTVDFILGKKIKMYLIKNSIKS